MKTVYSFILENYNLRNKSDSKGVLFGFKYLNNKPINCVEDLYQYFIDNPYISVAFDFWSNEYCILKVRVDEDIDFIPINFNNGTTNPRHSSFIQVHYSHLRLGDILGVYNMIDYKSGKKI